MQKEQQEFKSFVESKVIKLDDLPATPQKQVLPLTSLDWKLFEQLCCRLIAHEPNTEGTPYLYGIPGEDQKGVDIVAKKRVSDTLQTWCYQCKDYQDLSSSDFKQAIKKLEYKADHYVFLIACEAVTKLQNIADENGVEIWDARSISSKLKNYPNLVADFFGLAWKKAFCIPQELTGLSALDIYRPPKPKQPFVGREAELATLSTNLNKQRIIFIEGIGGIGKTEILLQALEKIDYIPTAWFDVEAYETFSDLLQAILRAFSKEGFTIGTEQELFAYLDRQPLRIVFDGLDRIAISEWDQVTDFLSLLTRSTKQPKFVITTQIEASNLEFEAFRLPLDILEPKASEYLLRLAWEKQQVKVHEADVGWLLELCDGHPLSLRLLIGLIRYYKNTKVVVDRLRLAGADEFKDPLRKKQKTSTALEACLKAVYSHFDHEQKRLLLFISNFPVGCIDLYAQQFQKNGNFASNLAELRRFFFIDVREDPIRLNIERFHILNPIKLFIRGTWKAEALAETVEIQLDVATELMVHIAVISQMRLDSNITDFGLAMVDYDLLNYEIAVQNIIEAMKWKKLMHEDVRSCLEIVMYIAFGLYSYFFVRIFQTSCIYLIQAGIDAGEQLGSGHLSIVSTLYNVLFSIKQRLLDYKGCEELIKRMTAINQKIDDPGVKALYSITLGDFALQRHQFSSSVNYYKTAEAYYESVLRNDPSTLENNIQLENNSYYKGMLGQVKSCLGHAYEYQKDYQKAIVLYLEAVRYLTEMQDNLNIGSVYHQLGNCHAYMREFTKAFDYYIQAIEYFAPLEFGQFLSNSMSELGLTLLEIEFISSAKDFFNEHLIFIGLEDVGREIDNFIEKDKMHLKEDALFPRDAAMLLQKVLGIIILCSFTDYKALLETWATKLLKDVVISEINATTAMLKQIDKMSSDYRPYNLYWTFLYEVYILLEVAIYIGQIIFDGNQKQDNRVTMIYDICEDLHEPFSDQVFKWLEKLFSRQ